MEHIPVILPPALEDSQLRSPCWPTLWSSLQHCSHMEGTPIGPRAAGCAGKQPTSSFTTCEEATQHTVLTWNRVKPT